MAARRDHRAERGQGRVYRAGAGRERPGHRPRRAVAALRPGQFPVIAGAEFGHQQRKVHFPLGCRVESGLDGPYPVLRCLEDLVTRPG